MKRSFGPIVSNRDNELSEQEVEEFKANPYPDDIDRPKVREDCWDFANDRPKGMRPCPFVGCRYNNFLWLTKRGTIILNHPERSPEDVPPDESCAWDVAERPIAPEEKELGEIMGVSAPAAHAAVESAQASARRIRKFLRKLTVIRE